MKFFGWLLLIFPFMPITLVAQPTYSFENAVSVIEGDITLTQPFSGGFVAPQFSVIDLNLDGTDDLFVFDRASNKIFTYILRNGEYIYQPMYESLLPSGLNNWVLLRDYNCDGKMDLFTSSIFGMSLYENTSTDELNWTLIHQTIYTEGSNGQTNLQVSGLDLPAIVDVDNDGDLDILNFSFATGGGIEFHKNFSVENTGSCDLNLERVTRKYGNFEECTCETYIFGADVCPSGGKIAHTGGKTILSFEYAGQPIQDLLIGQEFCELPGYLPNTGTSSEALMEKVSFDFPTATDPLRMDFPAFYSLDLYNDGTQDLIAAPNKYQSDGSKDYLDLSYHYSQSTNGMYELITNRFLKENMIDVGHMAFPIFTDIDFDGDEDLLIGTGKNIEGASIRLYENIGSPSQPSFLLKTNNYLELFEEGYDRIRMQFFDIDENDFLDLILTITKNNEIKSISFLHSGNPLEPYLKSRGVVLPLPSISIWDSPYYYKVGSKNILFMGKQGGNLAYYTSVEDFMSANWQLETDTYLGIGEDFNRRNLSITIADINANKNEDLVIINDSGEVTVYANFLNENSPEKIYALNENTDIRFDLNFGKLTNITTANLFGKLEPSLAIGLLTGGVQILNNTKSTDNKKPLELKIIGYPNPIKNSKIVIQSNKSGVARVLDAAGKEVLKGIEVKAGFQNKINLNVLEGVYFLEVTTSAKEKKVIRIVVAD